MDNSINEIRKQIRALRISMIEAETVMRAQIKRDEDCSFVAGEGELVVVPITDAVDGTLDPAPEL